MRGGSGSGPAARRYIREVRPGKATALGTLTVVVLFSAFAGALTPAGAQLPGLQLPEVGVESPIGGDRTRTRGTNVASTPPSREALARTIPVTARPSMQPVSIVSLPLKRVGPLTPGTALDAGGELQISVCLRRSIGRHRNGEGCSGRIYGYDPKVTARLVIAPGRGTTDPRRTVAVGPPQRLRCTQRQPDRNHHCVLAMPWRRVELGRDGATLPECAPRLCRLNLVASASHRAARPRERVVVGGMRDDGSVDNDGEARIAVVRYPPGAKRPGPPAEPLRSGPPLLRALPLSRDGNGVRTSSVASLRIPSPRRGERIRVAARFRSGLAGLRFNARTRTQLILADRPGAVRPGPRARRIAANSAYLAQESNFNCTHGPSGHRSPCTASKVGVVKIAQSSDRPLYLNLLAGHGAVGDSEGMRRPTDRVQLRAGTYVKAWRLGGTARSGGS